MKEQQNLPAKLNMPPEQVTETLLKMKFQNEISRKEYQQILQGIDDIRPTKENLKECQSKINQIEMVLTKFSGHVTETGKPYFNAHKAILKAGKEVSEPILNKVASKKAEMKAKNDELLSDLAKQAAEKARVDNIVSTMTLFINNCTQFITTATTDKQITAIQKRIGSEKSREGFYSEFLDEFKQKCAALDQLIKERKDNLQKEAELSAAAATALLNNDKEAAAEIELQREQLADETEETILRLQDEAFNQISTDIPVVVPEITSEALKGRNYWRWEVIDLLKLYKKHPELINLEPNKEAIDKFMSENRHQWQKDGKNEFIYDGGIKFFIKKFL